MEDINDSLGETVIKEVVEKLQSKSPGMRLQRSREAAGLSVADVANALYLTSTHIERLEADEYTATVGLTFERGYLRSYARLLQLSEDDIIDEFNQLGLQEPEFEVPSGLYGKPITSKHFHYARWIGIAAVIVLLLSLVIWWQEQRPGADEYMPTVLVDHVDVNNKPGAANETVPAVIAKQTEKNAPTLATVETEEDAYNYAM